MIIILIKLINNTNNNRISDNNFFYAGSKFNIDNFFFTCTKEKEVQKGFV